MWGYGRGWGFRRWMYGMPPVYPYGYVDPTQMAEIEKQWLRQYEAYLEAELRIVRERIAQLEGRVPPAPPAGNEI